MPGFYPIGARPIGASPNRVTAVVTVPDPVPPLPPLPFELSNTGKFDATQFINHMPIGASGKRLLASLFESLIDDLHQVRAAQGIMAAKLDADPAVTESNYVATASVPDAKVILSK